MGVRREADYAFYLYTCNKCGSCFLVNDGKSVVCPGYNHFGIFSHTGGGKLYIAQGVLEGTVKIDEKYSNTVFECMACGACEASCPAGIETMPVIKALREECWDRGVVPRQIQEVKTQKGKPHIPPKVLSQLSEMASFNGAEITVFWGCSTFSTKRSTQAALHFARVLSKAGIRWSFDPEESCCGVALEMLGDRKGSQALREKHVEKINASSGSRIIYFSPECFAGAMFATGVEKEVLFYADVLAELYSEGKIKLKGNGMRITYHDPCAMTRGAEMEEGLGGFLQALGVDFTAPLLSGRQTFCCGGGFGPKLVNPAFARTTAKKRLDHLKSTGADVFVTACPRCLSTLSGVSRKGAPQGLDISELFEGV